MTTPPLSRMDAPARTVKADTSLLKRKNVTPENIGFQNKYLLISAMSSCYNVIITDYRTTADVTFVKLKRGLVGIILNYCSISTNNFLIRTSIRFLQFWKGCTSLFSLKFVLIIRNRTYQRQPLKCKLLPVVCTLWYIRISYRGKIYYFI